MSYFKVIVDKDKFSLYDTSKDKYYVVEPNDVDHILNPDNPYNDDGSLNLLSYSDVINYFNRKYSKRKPTKGYTAKKANIKKEYSDVAKLNRRGEISKKIQSINISDENKRMIEKYPISEVVDLLNITANQKAAIRNILNDSNFKLDKDETNEIKQEFLRDKSLDIQKKATTDQLNAMNLNQLNQAAQLNQVANNLAQNQQNQAVELQNITNELNRNRVNFDNRVNQLAANQQAQNNQLILYNNAFQNYQRNMAAQLMQMDNNFDQYIRNLQADIQALPDGAAIQNAINNANWMGNIQNALNNINNSIAALPKTDDVRAIQDHVDRINGFFRQLPSSDQINQIQGNINQMQQKLLEMNIPNNAEQLEEINTSVNNLNNAIRAIKYPDYTQNLNEINQKIGMIAVHNNNNMIENRDELQNNINDNISHEEEIIEMDNNFERSRDWKIQSDPIDILRHTKFEGKAINVPHTIMRLLSKLEEVDPDLPITVTNMPDEDSDLRSQGNTYNYELSTFNDKIEFKVHSYAQKPFATEIYNAITSKNKWKARELLNTVIAEIKKNADSSKLDQDYPMRENISWKFKHGEPDPEDNQFYDKNIIKFATLLPSSNTKLKFDSVKGFSDRFSRILDDVINENNRQTTVMGMPMPSNASYDQVGKYIYDNLTTKIFKNPVVGFEIEGNDLFSPSEFQPIDGASPETVRADVENVTTGILKSYIKLYPDSNEMSKSEFVKAAKDYIKNLTDDTAPGDDFTYHYSNTNLAKEYGTPKNNVKYAKTNNAHHIIENMVNKFTRGTWDDLLANYKINSVQRGTNNKNNLSDKYNFVRPESIRDKNGVEDNTLYVPDESFARMAYTVDTKQFGNKFLRDDKDDLNYSTDSEEGFGGKVSSILSNRIHDRFRSNPFNNNSDNKIVSILMKKF